MFTDALFAIAKTQKQLKCPLTEEWIKMWYIYTTEYYSAIKKNKIMPFVATWRVLEIIILSEVSQRKKKVILISFIYEILKYGTNELTCKIEIKSQMQKTYVWLPKGKEEEE